MYLKALELFGFKTFADRTRLTFGPGVSAIVGPNGSGKSNIADALLFVLGEQSSRSIRTSQLSDVIFNGTEKRKPMGIAEATLVLDNSDGGLDLPYSEVAITRRTHRDGESEYFLNRTRCRLRDIQELLLDTGLGKETYSMIGQSDVERLLSLRPEDRRAMFEEAAGTAKYRGRRNEALRRLESVQGNLLRIHDIHTEVEQQLEPLARQAEKAREHRALHEEFRGLAVGALAAEARRASEIVGRCAHEAFVVRADLERFEAEAAQLELRAAEWRERRDEVEAALEEARRANGRIQAEIARLESDIAVATERIASCGSQTGILTRDVEALEEERVALGERIAELRQQRQAAAVRLDELRPVEEQRTAEFSVVEKRIEQLNAAIAAAGRRQRETVQKLASLDSSLAAMRGQRRDLEGRIVETDREITELAGQATAEEARAAHLDEELVSLEDAEREASGAVDDARRGVETAQRGLEGEIEGRSRARAKLGEIDARLASLEEIERAGGHLPRGVRHALRERASGNLAGVLGTVADTIHVAPEYERAISAALGEWARALVVESADAAWAVVRRLQDDSAGYAMLLPSDLEAPERAGGPISEVLGSPGILGRAIDLVSFPKNAAGLVERLLGATAVARDLESAQAVADRLGRGGSMVTLAGERADAAGAIGGGSSLTAAEDPITLSATREDLQKRRIEATEALEATEERIADARDAIEAAKGKVADAEREYQARLATIQQTGARAAVCQERVRNLRARREKLESERNERTVQLGELDRRLAATSKELESVATPIEDDPAVSEEALAELGKERDAARDALAEARLAIRDATEQLRSLDPELSGAPQRLQTVERRIAEARASLVALGSSESDETRRVAECRAGLEAQRRAGQDVLERLRGLGDQRLSVLAGIEEADRLGKDARAQIPDLRAALSGHEIRGARAEEHRSAIQERLGEEFSLTLEEADAHALPPEQLGAAQERLRSLRARLAQMGEVNSGAEAEYERLAERERFLAAQRADLEAARENLREIIAEIDAQTKVQFLQAFNTIADQFQRIFRFFFAGGQTQLTLTDPDNLLETGIEVSVKPPGRAKQSLLSLSGGERAITSISLLFAMLRVRPAPFCVLDEIDAPLDEANTERFASLLQRFTDQTQFLVITHAPGTMQGSNQLYGVTMQEKGVSCSLSIALEDAEDVIEGRATAGRNARDVLFAGREGEDLEG